MKSIDSLMSNINYIKELRETGGAPIVNLKIFDSVKKLKFNDAILDHHSYTMDMYKEYLYNIESLQDNKIIPYLKAIKTMESIDNQAFEQEDSFLMAIYSQMEGESAIDYLLENPLTRETLINGHKILLRGTKSEDYVDRDYRDGNETYVGYTDNGKIHVDYFPISYTEIEEAIGRLLEFYHSDDFNDNMFLKAQIIHGLVATLQMFNDGNCRYGRILQNIRLGELTKEQLDYPYDIPALYGTRSYMPFRYDYRNLIKMLAINPGVDEWNKWFEFNLNRAEDTMYFSNEKLMQYKKVRL